MYSIILVLFYLITVELFYSIAPVLFYKITLILFCSITLVLSCWSLFEFKQCSYIFRALEEQVAEDPNMMIKRPIIILTDVNHMHFASGAPPVAVIEGDLLSPLPEVRCMKSQPKIP